MNSEAKSSTREGIKGQTTTNEAALNYDLTPAEVERWVDDFMSGVTNAIKTNPKDLIGHAAYG